jgi:hypothetical protein
LGKGCAVSDKWDQVNVDLSTVNEDQAVTGPRWAWVGLYLGRVRPV